MKKLISAASALAMAASMVGTAVPFATGAADSTKGFELRAFESRAGEAVSTTISADEIAAGDVTIPIGVYLLENTADCESIKAEWTVNSEDGDASNTYVTFSGVQHATDYYDTEREVTLASGKSAVTKRYVPFAGAVKGGKLTLTAGENMFSTAAKQDSSNCPNAWGSVMWTPVSGQDYAWSGATSDEYPMFVFEAKFAKGTPAGTYTIDFVDIIKDPKFPDNRSSMIESPAGKMTSAKNNLTFKGIEIKIGDGGEAPSTTTTTASSATKPTTTTVSSTNDPGEVTFVTIDDFIINVPDIELEPGESKEVSFTVENPGKHKAATLSAFLAKITDGVTIALNEEDNPFCEAVPGDKEWIHSGIVERCDATESGTKHPQDVADGNIISLIVTADATAEPGVYDYGLNKFHLVESAKEGDVREYDVKVNNGKLTIKGEVKTTTTNDVTTTTSNKVTTTTSDKTTTTTTQAPNPAIGNAEWFIPTVHAKPGEEVVLDVIVKGKSDLAVAGASYDVNAKSPIEFVGVDSSSNTYKSAVVYNSETKEFAFGDKNKGVGVVAGENAVIMKLTYKVPEGTPGGKYDVIWSNAFVSDTDGNDITMNVTLTDGAIIVDDENFEGEIAWKIPTVHAKPGETVKMEVAVEDPEGAALPVAGAQFAISAVSPIEYNSVSGQSDGYKAAIVNNANTNEFAFGEGKGAGISADDGAKVLVLEYTVPAGTAAGEYPVTWGGDIYISDTNGNALTEQISLIDGAIIVDEDVAEGNLTWTIPEVEAEPGDTVEMEVEVTVGEKNLPVAGAQFEINAASPVVFSAVGGQSDAYKAAIVNNDKTNEFAFSESKGAGVEAADKSVVLKLTYTVPDDIEPGRYPVEWANAFISDTNGNEVTSSVKLIDGAIIIKAPDTTTTTSKPATTTSTATTDKTTTTSTATTTTVSTTVTTTETAPAGKIIWQIDTVEAEPGDEVELKVYVNDANAVNLPIGGAQFSITETTPIEYVSVSESSEGYKAEVVSNGETREFAFADSKGNGVAAANGANVIVLTYKVPEDCEPGIYPVEFGDNGFFNISSADGVDMTEQIVRENGAIIVKAPVTTTTTSTPTTSTATSTTTTDEATTTSTATTTTVSTTVTTTETAPAGKIIWQIDTVEAEPGDEVELKVYVNDANAVNLPIGGAQFSITETTPIEYVSVSESSEGYKAEVVSNGETREFAFADSKGNGVAAANGANVIVLTYKVPEDCEPGIYPVEFGDNGFFNISSADGVDMTEQIVRENGAIIVKAPVTTTTTSTPTTTSTATSTITTTDEATTTSTATSTSKVTSTSTATSSTTASKPATTTTTDEATSTSTSKATSTSTVTSTSASSSATTTVTPLPGTDTATSTTNGMGIVDNPTVAVETEVGYYFSHDPRPFKTEQVNITRMWGVDETGKEVEIDVDPSLITFSEVISGSDTPEGAHNPENMTFKYTVRVLYDGHTLQYDDGKIVTVTAYIGVKGDTNLDNMSDARDASNVLAYYANASTLDEGETVEDIRMSPENCEPVNNDPDLDTLCAFLGDVDLDVYSKDNWRKTKSDREIDAKDASWILAYYSYMSTEENAIPHEGWNYSLESKDRGEKFDAYVESGTEE